MNDKSMPLWKKEIVGKTTKDFEKAFAEISKEVGTVNVACDIPMNLEKVMFKDWKDEITDPTWDMPTIDIKEYDSPNYSERGSAITGIVLHNTASTFNSALSWLCNPEAQASCHLIIGRDGTVACIVPFSKKAWHAGNSRVNASTIGIEIEATETKKGMTPVQEKVLKSWIKWFCHQYGIKKEGITPHRNHSSTDCPVLIWPTNTLFNAWVNENF